MKYSTVTINLMESRSLLSKKFDRIKKLELVARTDQLKRATERYEIFVAGPFIDIKKSKKSPENSSSAGKKIRFHVYNYYKSSGHNMYLGEDHELRIIGEKHYGPSSNATFFERHYINNNIDSLIVFPDGPGVFCEFGDWATTEITCKKMLVLIDKQYEGKASYINDGTAKAAIHHGATVIYQKYTDFNAIIGECDRFIDRLAIRSRVDQLYGK